MFRPRLYTWWDLARIPFTLAPAVNPPHPWDLSGAPGWSLICGPVAAHPDYIASSYHWRWDATTTTPPGFCGLTGQAVSGIDDAPLTTDKTFRTFYKLDHPTLNRYQVRETWTRPDSGPVPEASSPRPAFSFAPGLPHWPTDLPLPLPFTIPGGAIAPTPLPTTWPRIPRRPQYPLPTPGVQIDQGGNGQPNQPIGDIDNPEPIVREISFGNNAPRTQTRFRPRGPRRKERELKSFYKSAGYQAINKLIGSVTEFADLVTALYNSLPAAVRRETRRDHNGFLRHQDKAAAVWRNWSQLNVEEALRLFFRMQVTDFFWAQTGRGDAWYGQQTGGLGWTSASRDGDRQKMLEDFYKHRTGEDMERLDPAGEAFDWLWDAVFGG